jgi:hypothetical protein
MFLSDAVVIDIEDKSIQAINTNVVTEFFVTVLDKTTRTYPDAESENVIKISTVTTSGVLTQTPVEFTDALYDAKLATTASFAVGEVFTTEVKIVNYKTAYNYLISETLVETGSYRDEDVVEQLTHKIQGTLTHEGRVTVLEQDTHELIKSEVFSSGNYTINIPQRLKVDVVAKRISDAEMKGYGEVVPMVK